MIFKEEKIHKWYIETCFPGWQEIKSFTWEIAFLKFPISFALFFDEDNMVKLGIDHAVCEEIAATDG